MENEEDDNQEYDATFDSTNCTCEHESDEHGWDGCNVDNCPCEASWEE